MTQAPKHRWPGYVYSVGSEPDYRFTYANERTMLAWIRTSLALVAGGVAVRTVDLDIPTVLAAAVGAAMVSLGLMCAAHSWMRWARSERAMRREEPLPSSPVGAILSVGMVVAAAIILVVAW